MLGDGAWFIYMSATLSGMTLSMANFFQAWHQIRVTKEVIYGPDEMVISNRLRCVTPIQVTDLTHIFHQARDTRVLAKTL
jgi:hypothetical protein